MKYIFTLMMSGAMLFSQAQAPLFTNASFINESSQQTVSVTTPVFLAGTIFNNKALLQWGISNNETVDHFELQKSSDGQNFKTAGIVFTSEKNGAETYLFKDGLSKEKGTYYRLRVITRQQTETYTNTVSLKQQSANNSIISLLQNPVEEQLKFQYYAREEGVADIMIYNVQGRPVLVQKQHVKKGNNTISLMMDNTFRGGNYVLEVVNKEVKVAITFVKK